MFKPWHTARIPRCRPEVLGRLQPSLGVVKDDSDCVAHALAEAADAVPEVDAVSSLCALNRPVVDGESDRIALAQWHDFSAALHARALLRENEFATREIPSGLGEQDRDLKRKCEVAI